MLKGKLAGLGALALTATSAAFGNPLRAQAPQGAREQVQLAFGYECDDRFLVRNDGAQAVDVEYTVQGAPARSKLHLNAKESAEMSSVSSNPVELWVNGKLVATERKGNRACATAPVQSSQDVVVRPIEPREGAVYSEGAPVYTAPPVVVVAPRPYYGYDPYYPYYDPYYYGGFRSSFSVVLPFYSGYSRVGYGGRFVTRGRPFVGRGRGRH
jgi:hypothetical protein